MSVTCFQSYEYQALKRRCRCLSPVFSATNIKLLDGGVNACKLISVLQISSSVERCGLLWSPASAANIKTIVKVDICQLLLLLQISSLP